MASEPRVLAWTSENAPRMLRKSRVQSLGVVVPLIDGNEAAAREARLVALLADARSLLDDGWMLLTENGQSAEWHDHRRAWIAACEEVTGGSV